MILVVLPFCFNINIIIISDIFHVHCDVIDVTFQGSD